MAEKLISKRLDAVLQMPAKEAKKALPSALDEICSYGIEKVLKETPDLLSKIIEKMLGIGAAGFLTENPASSDKFTDLMWQVVGSRFTDTAKLRTILEKTKTKVVNVNFEASDSPLRTHFTFTREKLSGASGMVHFKDEDFRFFGATDILLLLFIDKLSLGFSNVKLQGAGHGGFLSLLRPLTKDFADILNGK